MKKILEICALIVLMACLISGCTKKSNEEIEKRVYYEETEIPLPEETSILYDIESADQQLVVLAGGETISGRKYSYEENENSWKEGGAVWKDIEDSVVFEAKFLNKKQNYVSVLYQALLVQSEEEGKMLEPKYFVLEEDGSTEELSLNLSEGDAYTEDNLFHCMVSDKNKLVGVDNGGVISCFSMDGILLYTDEEPHKAESGVVGMVLDKEILYVVMDNGKVLCLDAETGEHKEGSESLVEFLKFTEGSYLAECDGTNVYKIQKNKLYQYDLKKKAAKELMDFSGYDLEDGYDYLLSPSGEGEFYISCISRTGQNILRKYTYIKEGIQVQKDALTIYSLEENSNIQMLADAFEAKNPDISIKVEYGYTEEDGKTREDAMELLNTEMMAGKGPDILVLDGLSTDAYIQKGMLKDLEEILDLEVMERELFSNLLTPYKMEGGQFAIPCGFSLYGITGEKEAVRAFHDTEQLLAYAKRKSFPLQFMTITWQRQPISFIFRIFHLVFRKMGR